MAKRKHNTCHKLFHKYFSNLKNTIGRSVKNPVAPQPTKYLRDTQTLSTVPLPAA